MIHTITVGWAFHHAEVSFDTDTLTLPGSALFERLPHPAGCLCQSFYVLLDGDAAELTPLTDVLPTADSLWRVESLAQTLTGMGHAWTTVEAAEHWGLTPVRVRQLCQAGRIPGAQKVGRDWIIPPNAEVSPGSRGPKGVATMIKVVTWQAPCGRTIDLTGEQEEMLHARKTWPMCPHCRQPYAQVSHGRHPIAADSVLSTEALLAQCPV